MGRKTTGRDLSATEASRKKKRDVPSCKRYAKAGGITREPSPPLHIRPSGPDSLFATMENPYELVRTSYRESSKVYRSDMFLPDRGLGADDATNLQVLPPFPQIR